jgi:two-component sensor histidine kinase
VSGSLEGDDIKIVWMERGGPDIEPSKATGYGSRLVERSVKGQLGGAIDYAWETAGLIVTLTLRASKLTG